MFGNFYKSKKVFITGHTGFKGSWLALWLDYLGANVKGYALEPHTHADHYLVTNLGLRIDSVIADIRDYERLEKEIKIFSPDIIFHLAAQPLVRDSYTQTKYTYEVNIIGTVNILEILKNTPSVISFVNVTTDKCYENIECKDGYKETDLLGGHDPYSSSKACSELITSAYRRSFFYEELSPLIVTVRAGNVIGGGDWCKDRIIPDSINDLFRNVPVRIRNPKAIRPWQYVLEPLSGYLWLATQRTNKNYFDYAGAWNFGPELNSSVTVQQVVEFVIQKWGKGSWSSVAEIKDLHEAEILNLDCTKAHNQLHWHPVLSVEESAALTVDWYKEFYLLQNKNMYAYSKQQLKKYCSLAQQKKIPWAQ